ncbi:MAG TPA: hypothetical protein VF952_02070 [Chloroflexia bacterium]
MSEDLVIAFSANGRSLALQIQGRPAPHSADAWEDATLGCVILAETGSFCGRVSTTIWVYELATLKNMLVDLDRSLGKDARAEFSSLESALRIEFSMLRSGGLTLNVEIHDGPTLEDSLAFVIEADQSYLSIWLEQLTHILSHLD